MSLQVEPCARCYQDPVTKEMVLAATGELHLEILLKDLEEFARTPIVARCAFHFLFLFDFKFSSLTWLHRAVNRW